MRRRLIATLGIVLLGGAAAPAAAEDWRAERAWIAGTDDAVWVLGESAAKGGESPVVQMWFAGEQAAKDARPQQNSSFPPLTGKLLFVGADVQALRVLYSDLSAYDYFTDRTSGLGAVWRDQCSDRPPLAWGGDATEPTLWALAETAALVAPTTRAAGTASQPVTTGPATEPSANEPASRPNGEDDGGGRRLTLLKLRDGTWSRRPVRPEASEGRQFWLSGRQGVLCLFWHVPDRGVWASSLRENEWTEPMQVTAEQDVQSGWAGLEPDGPVFIAGVSHNASGVELRLFLFRGETWSDMGLARDGLEPLRIDPGLVGVAVVRGLLGVARPTAGGGIEYGHGELGTSPSIRFSALALGTTTSPERSEWENAIVLGILMAALTWMFWSRRDQLVTAAKVPPGMIIAPLYQRLLGGLLDLIPSTLLFVTVWFSKVLVIMGPVPLSNLDALQKQTALPELRAALEPWFYASLVLFSLWGMVWELAMGTTPGKLLFRCRVLSLDGSPPTARQIVLRNAARPIELGMDLAGLVLTLMIMAFLTRNRQRIGDVLAGTVVVGPGTQPPDTGVDRPDDADHGP